MKKLIGCGLAVLALVAALLWWTCPEDRSYFEHAIQQWSGMFGRVTDGGAANGEGADSESRSLVRQDSEPGARVRSAPGARWREPLTGMEFVWIPEGCYRMGSDPEEPGRDRDEGPLHQVCLNGFWLGIHLVTRGQFRLFVEQTGYVTDAEKEGYAWVYAGKWEKKPGYSWRRAGFPQDPTHPVVNVSWNDAKAMAAWLSEEDGRGFCLPSEAQWEYACRAGSVTARYWGDGAAPACDYANVADQTAREKFPVWEVHPCRDGYVFTAPVGSFRSNDFGLYDMLGNVWQWCEDAYDPGAYARHVRTDPVRTKGGRARVVRGGSWYSQPRFVRCASRDHLSVPSRRSQDQGFRLAIEP